MAKLYCAKKVFKGFNTVIELLKCIYSEMCSKSIGTLFLVLWDVEFCLYLYLLWFIATTIITSALLTGHLVTAILSPIMAPVNYLPHFSQLCGASAVEEWGRYLFKNSLVIVLTIAILNSAADL